MVPDEAIFERNATFADSPVGEAAVILNTDELLYFAVNRVGARIWRLLESPRTLGELVQILSQEFAVEPSICRQETSAFLYQLLDRKLAVRQGGDR